MAKNSITKRELLRMMDESTLKHDSHKKQLYYRYYPLIENMLSTFPDKVKIEDLPCLNNFTSRSAFETYIRANDFDSIESKLKTIYSELQTWVLSNARIPTGAEQKRMRQDVIQRLDRVIYNLNQQSTAPQKTQIVDSVLQILKDVRETMSIIFLPRSDVRIHAYYKNIIEQIERIDDAKIMNPRNGDINLKSVANNMLEISMAWANIEG